MNLTECEELLDDVEEKLLKSQQEMAYLRRVLTVAIRLTDMEYQITETMIEAALHPLGNPDRCKLIGTTLEDLFKTVTEWRNVYKPDTAV